MYINVAAVSITFTSNEVVNITGEPPTSLLSEYSMLPKSAKTVVGKRRG